MHLMNIHHGKISFQQWNFHTIVAFKYQYKLHHLMKTSKLTQVPNAYSPFSVETQSTRAQDLAIKLKAIHTRTHDLIVEAQAEQEILANRTRERIKYEVGEWILLQ